MKNAFAELATLVLISVAAAGATWAVKGPPAKAPLAKCDSKSLKEDEICFADVTGNVLWVDARSRAEWEKNGLQGSTLWNLDPKEDMQQFEAETAMKVLEVDLVVVYCGSKTCGTSRQVADRIRNLQLGPSVKVLYGGWDSIRDSNSGP